MKISQKKSIEQTINFQNLEIKVSFKKIKNIILKVKQDQKILLSVPTRISQKQIDEFIINKLDWINSIIKKYEKYQSNKFLYLGSEYTLKYIHHNHRTPKIEIVGSTFNLYINDAIPEKTRTRYLEKCLEENLILITQEFFAKWEKNLGVSKNSLVVKKLKGKWGYCHIKSHDICLNLELIKKNPIFIEYVVLHELCHILVPDHGSGFKALLNKHMPEWKKIVKEYSL